ncbi:MAG: hypothetical protein RR706_09360 [Muribaculaceae bacterium]
MKKYLLLPLFIICMFSACNKSDEFIPEIEEQVNELILSAKWNVDTESVEYEFDILDGNGDYTASFSEEDAGKVVIEGTKVKVSLLKNHVSVTITDKKQQSKTVIINSTAKSLIPQDYSIFIVNGDTYTMKDISFGVGGYGIEKINGNSAEVSIDENDNVKISTLRQGNSYYKLIDKRGTTASLNVLVGAIYDLVANTIRINAVNDQTFSIVLKNGNAWKVITKEPYSPIIDEVYLMPKSDTNKYDVLQINTAKGDMKGSTTIELKDKTGNIALVTVMVN